MSEASRPSALDYARPEPPTRRAVAARIEFENAVKDLCNILTLFGAVTLLLLIISRPFDSDGLDELWLCLFGFWFAIAIIPACILFVIGIVCVVDDRSKG